MAIAATSPSGLSNRQIEEYVTLIANRYGLHDDGPVDLLAFVRRLGGTIDMAKGDESLHVEKPGEFTIRIPYFTSLARDRFTVAHELGHYFLHYLFPRLAGPKSYGRGDRGRGETEANVFASCLLMPKEQFKEAWERCEHDPWRLANEFEVSPSAASVRAQVLGLEE